MKIDYAKIIETADFRRATLQDLDKLLAGAAEFNTQLLNALDWIRQVRDAYATLDKEGRELLPQSTRMALEYLPSTVSSLITAVDNRMANPGGAAYGLTHLAKGYDE